jgi:hypothetical protein
MEILERKPPASSVGTSGVMPCEVTALIKLMLLILQLHGEAENRSE